MNNTRSLLLLIAAGVLLFLTTAITSSLKQPIQFNHQLHNVDVGLDCTDCHQYVLKSRKATLPGKEVCQDCHEEPQGESSEEQKLVDLLNSDQELAWQRVYILPEHVYFSHFRHVTLGQIACAQCHGDMAALTKPPTDPAVDILDMDYCMDCHLQRQVSVDCLMCHN